MGQSVYFMGRKTQGIGKLEACKPLEILLWKVMCDSQLGGKLGAAHSLTLYCQANCIQLSKNSICLVGSFVSVFTEQETGSERLSLCYTLPLARYTLTSSWPSELDSNDSFSQNSWLSKANLIIYHSTLLIFHVMQWPTVCKCICMYHVSERRPW